MDHRRNVLAALEPDQRTSRRNEPLPPRKLGWRTIVVLSFLRVYVVLAIPLVVAAFIRALKS